MAVRTPSNPLKKNAQLYSYPLTSTTVHQFLSFWVIFYCFCKAKHSRKPFQTLQKIFDIIWQYGRRFKHLPNLAPLKKYLLDPYPLISTIVHQVLSIQEIIDCLCKAKHSRKPFQRFWKNIWHPHSLISTTVYQYFVPPSSYFNYCASTPLD